ncbi:hypothetical protein FGU64_09980 [Mesorhizobium sp. 8]|nr:hypothetical protein FGU64_09980 [Mesorhizobium sp. 8]
MAPRSNARAEQTYLLELGRPDLDWKERIGGDIAPSAQLLALMNGLDPNPAYVLDKYWQVKACNEEARRLFGDIDQLCDVSEQFKAYWLMTDVEDTPFWQKMLRHSLSGSLNFTFASLRPSGEDAVFTLSLHTPANREARESLERLVRAVAPE